MEQMEMAWEDAKMERWKDGKMERWNEMGG
jgi:hypothetical protein